MSAFRHNQALSRLVIDLGRSLLQYVGESWPWTSSTSSARETLEALVERQRAGVARLFDLLNRRGVIVDFGTYPTEYTDLHYCALSFLVGQLLEEAGELSREISFVRAECADDPEAAALLDGLAADQKSILDGLRGLAGRPVAGAAA